MTISIISASVRDGRASHRIALFFRDLVSADGHKVEILDLKSYNFPIFHERLKYQKDPIEPAKEFASKISASDGVIIVTPEYNGSMPASLKNAIDLLVDEWHRKPVAISTASAGPFAGSQVLTHAQFSLWKIGAVTVPAMFPVPKVAETFDESGKPSDDATYKRAAKFIGELYKTINAK